MFPVKGGRKCQAIIRIEDGTLWDVEKLFLSKINSHRLPPGTVELLSAAGHLPRVETSFYISELVDTGII